MDRGRTQTNGPRDMDANNYAQALHYRDDIDRFYEQRKEGGRGLSSMDDCINASIQGLVEYIKKSK